MADQNKAVTIRASATLAGSGAYDTPTAILLKNFRNIQFFLTYTRAAAGGSMGIKIEYSPDGTNWFRKTAMDAEAVTTATSLALETQTMTYLYKNESAAAQAFALPVLKVCTAQMRISVAEVGATGTPGTAVAIMYYANSGNF